MKRHIENQYIVPAKPNNIKSDIAENVPKHFCWVKKRTYLVLLIDVHIQNITLNI